MWPGSGLDLIHEPRAEDTCDRCEVVDVAVEFEFGVEIDGREVLDTGVGPWYRCGLSARSRGLANRPSIGVGESSVSVGKGGEMGMLPLVLLRRGGDGLGEMWRSGIGLLGCSGVSNSCCAGF